MTPFKIYFEFKSRQMQIRAAFAACLLFKYSFISLQDGMGNELNLQMILFFCDDFASDFVWRSFKQKTILDS